MPRVFWNAAGDRIFYTATEQTGPQAEKTSLYSVKPDGTDIFEQMQFKFAEEIVPSPDGKWVAWNELHNAYITLLPTAGRQTLEVSGDDHPLHDYLDADVPVALGTDDQGVARSSLAAEYRRAVVDQGLDYHTLKRMARMSLEYAFLPGESLWFDLESAVPATPCVHPFDQVLGLDSPPDPCIDYLVDNERAGLQYELERRFRLFEATY